MVRVYWKWYVRIGNDAYVLEMVYIDQNDPYVLEMVYIDQNDPYMLETVYIDQNDPYVLETVYIDLIECYEVQTGANRSVREITDEKQYQGYVSR